MDSRYVWSTVAIIPTSRFSLRGFSICGKKSRTQQRLRYCGGLEENRAHGSGPAALLRYALLHGRRARWRVSSDGGPPKSACASWKSKSGRSAEEVILRLFWV